MDDTPHAASNLTNGIFSEYQSQIVVDPGQISEQWPSHAILVWNIGRDIRTIATISIHGRSAFPQAAGLFLTHWQDGTCNGFQHLRHAFFIRIGFLLVH